MSVVKSDCRMGSIWSTPVVDFVRATHERGRGDAKLLSKLRRDPDERGVVAVCADGVLMGVFRSPSDSMIPFRISWSFSVSCMIAPMNFRRWLHSSEVQ